MEEVCIINYGLGNVQSLKNALIKCGHKPIVTADINLLQNSKKLSCQVWVILDLL